MAKRVEELMAGTVSAGGTGLDLSGHGLTAVPESLRELTTLTELNLSRNELTAVPQWLAGLTALERLDLSGNQLTALPDALGELVGLTYLNIADNALTHLPWSVGRLTALEELHLDRNGLIMLPPGVVELDAMTDFDLQASGQVTTIQRTGTLTCREGYVSIWLDTWYTEMNVVIGWYDHDYSESGGGGPLPRGFRGSYVESWRDGAMAAAEALGISGADSMWMLFDHFYDAEPGPMGGPDDGVFLGAIAFQR